MKSKTSITTLIAWVILATIGIVAVNFNHPNTAYAFNVGFKKGLPHHFKHSWIGEVIDINNGSSKNFIVKNGSTYKFATNYWDQNGKNEPDKDTYFNLKLKYSLKIGKNQYLLATKSSDTKYLVLAKFKNKKTMRYSFAEVTKSGKLYQISDNLTMKAATKSATENAMKQDFISSDDNTNDDNIVNP